MEGLTYQFVVLLQLRLKEVLPVLLVGYQLLGDIVFLNVCTQLSVPLGALSLHLMDLA